MEAENRRKEQEKKKKRKKALQARKLRDREEEEARLLKEKQRREQLQQKQQEEDERALKRKQETWRKEEGEDEDDEELQLAIQLSLSVGITQMTQWPKEKGFKEVNQPEIINNPSSKAAADAKKGGKEARTETGPECDFCHKRMGEKAVPFYRLSFRYCSTKCVQEHRKQLGK